MSTSWPVIPGIREQRGFERVMKKLQALMIAATMVVGAANLALANDKPGDHKDDKKEHKDDHKDEKKKH